MIEQLEKVAIEIAALQNYAATIDDGVSKAIIEQMARLLTLMLEDLLDSDRLLVGEMPWWSAWSTETR